MKAIRLQRGSPLPPFDDPVGDLPILNESLARVQEAVLAGLGVELVGEAPREPHLVFSDRTWFTKDTIRRLLAAGPGRLKVEDEAFLQATMPLQDLPEPGLFELALHPGDGRPFEEIPPVAVDLDLHDAPIPTPHPKLAHAMRPVRVGAAMVHQLDHWSHILRVNHFALAALAEELKQGFDRSPFWKKLGAAAFVLGKARSLDPAHISAALVERGKKVKVHPTAVVEASRLADGVEIGAHSVVRGAILGPGAFVEEHATIIGSIIGPKAVVGRYAMANWCVVMGGAQVSTGGGWQLSVFGRESFVAWGATGLDLSFGSPIKVEHRGRRVSSGHHLLGVAIGHRAAIGNSVRLNHGIAIPNDAVVVASAEDVVRDATLPEGSGPFVVREGRLESIVRRG